MTETRPAGSRADARADGRTAMTRASDARPFKPYVYRGGDIEPAAVTAARERHRALNAALEATQAEVMPDIGPGMEWYRELADQDAVPRVHDHGGRAPGDAR